MCRNQKIIDLEPIILLGMHRSGTSILSQLLTKLGVFTGIVNNQGESRFFVARNEMLLRRAGGSWDHPLPFRDLLQDADLCRAAIERMLRSVGSAEFLGFTGIRRRLDPIEIVRCRPWGWKDPRTIFTLPVWTAVFPRARLVYLYRNGVDVAASLSARARGKSSTAHEPGLVAPLSLRRRLVNAVLPVERYVRFSARCLQLERSFELWEEYVSEAEEQLEVWRGPAFRLAFEDLLCSPERNLDALMQFVGLRPDRIAAQNALAGLDKCRPHRFQEKPDLVDFYETVRTNRWMQHLGYGDVDAPGQETISKRSIACTRIGRRPTE